MNVTSQVKFQIINEAVKTSSPSQGIIFVQGETLRGPIADPSEIITSPKRFRAVFGNINTTSLFPLICMAMLERGAFLRVNRVAAGTPATASSTAFQDRSDNLFQIVAKYPGVDYNNVRVTVDDATNGDTDSFNLTVEHLIDTTIVERYENLKITGTPTVAASDYLKKVTNNSTLVTVVYSDLSALTGPLRPVNEDKTLTGGSDGSAPGLADYTGASADQDGFQDGFYAFDPYDDSYALCCPAIGEGDMAGLSAAGAGYAANRKDLVYYAHLSLDNLTATALIAEKPAINTMWAMISSGGNYVTHPISGDTIEVPEIGFFLARMAAIHREYGEWYAFFGPTLGVINGTLGAVNNLGSNAQLADLNLLAQRQINMMVTRNGSTYLADAYTSEVAESPVNHVSVVNLLIFIKKVLGPTLYTFMGLPLDLPLISSIYYTVKPFFDRLKDNRAIFEYAWEGDQFASSVSELQVNDPVEFGNGKYLVNLRIIPISPLKEISVNIILTQAGVELNVNN